MDKIEYDLDTSGGLMEEIQKLIAPPQSEDAKKRQTQQNVSYSRRQTKAINHDHCDACNEDGDLLCCDQCPASFHLQCCDPPLEDEDVPTGEWVCNECRYNSSKPYDTKCSSVPSACSSRSSSPVDFELAMNPFEKLSAMYRNKNPKEFQFPPVMQEFFTMPGDRKRKKTNESKRREEETHRLCFICSRSDRLTRLINCDFCPLVFHQDCLMPPLAQEPIGMWMCPNHPENFEPNLRLSKFSERNQIIEDLRSSISHTTVKLQFFARAKKERILMNRVSCQPKKRRVCLVPDIVKAQYRNPPAVMVPSMHASPHLLPHMKPFTLPTAEEKEHWLKSIIDLQCSIASSLESKKPPLHPPFLQPVSSSGTATVSTATIPESTIPLNECKTEEQSTKDVEIKQEEEGTKDVVSSKVVLLPPVTQPSPTKTDASSIGKDASTTKLSTSKMTSLPSSGSHMVSSISAEILKDPTLTQLDDRLVRILAFQRLQQLVDKKSQQIPKVSKPGLTEKKILQQIVQTKKAIAVLSPLNGLTAPCYMRYSTFNAGLGADMDLCLSRYAFCNYVSGKHASIFFDKETGQFELLNYSEHGTIVDNVLYSCDFSEKPRVHITSSNARHETQVLVERTPPAGRTTRGLGTEFITKPCNCRASASSLIGGSGAGWEGTAVLHHGSYVKLGCLHFVFSIVDCNSLAANQNAVCSNNQNDASNHEREKSSLLSNHREEVPV